MSFGLFWTPDSRQIVSRLYRAQSTPVVAIDRAGHEQMILPSNDKDNVGFWRQSTSPTSPDNELIAFTVEKASFTLNRQDWVVVYDFQGQQRALFPGWGVMGWRAMQ